MLLCLKLRDGEDTKFVRMMNVIAKRCQIDAK